MIKISIVPLFMKICLQIVFLFFFLKFVEKNVLFFTIKLNAESFLVHKFTEKLFLCLIIFSF